MQRLTLQHVRSSFDVHFTRFQEAENGMFLIVQGLQKHQLCEATRKDSSTISFLLTFTMSDLGSTMPRLSSSTCIRRHDWPHATTGSMTTSLQRYSRIRDSRMTMSCSACITVASESDLQLANGLHIAFQVGSRHPTEQLSTTELHGNERVETGGFAIALSWRRSFHQREAMYVKKPLLVCSAAAGSTILD